MPVTAILSIIGAIGLIGLWLAYCIEAFRQTIGQGLLTLLVPAYVLYFAHVRSHHSRPWRWALIGFAALLLVSNSMTVAAHYGAS